MLRVALDVVEALRCWEAEPDITIKWWADGPAGRKAGTGRNAQAGFRDQIAQLINDFRTSTALPVIVPSRTGSASPF